jgi:hypothetical protein
VVSCRWEADASAPARKEKRRSSLRKLIAKKLRNGKRPSKDTDAGTCSVRGGERKHPEQAGEAGVNKLIVLVGENTILQLCVVFFSSVDRSWRSRVSISGNSRHSQIPRDIKQGKSPGFFPSVRSL